MLSSRFASTYSRRTALTLCRHNRTIAASPLYHGSLQAPFAQRYYCINNSRTSSSSRNSSINTNQYRSNISNRLTTTTTSTTMEQRYMSSAAAASGIHQRRILVSDPIEQGCIDILEEAGYHVDQCEKKTEDELIAMIPEYDGLIVRSGTTVTQGIIDAGRRLQLIGRAGTGVDNINVDAATMRGIMVMNTPGGNTVSAAELSVSLLMSLSRNIPAATKSLKSGKWERKSFMGTELSGKTIGIVGLGQIGRRVAQICQGLGMKTIGFDPILSKEVAREHGIDLVDMAELMRQSHCITLHTPLTAETRGMFNDDTFLECRKGLLIVNCARGGIIDEASLLRALESGRVAGAALDVYSKEPPPEEIAGLLAHDNVICTPHLGASTEEAQEKVASEIASQFVAALEGRAINGVVNSRILQELTVRKDLHHYIDLAERLGSLQAQLLRGKVQSIKLITRGNVLRSTNGLLTTAALKGILSQIVEDSVNYINAPILAEEMGLRIDEVHENFPSVYGNSLQLQFDTTSDQRRLTATVIGEDQPRIMSVDGLRCDAHPYGHTIFFRNMDRPGVIAGVTDTLSRHDVNIISFALGRKEVGGACVAAVGVDSPISEECLDALQQLPNMLDVRMTSLPSMMTPQSSSVSGGGGGGSSSSLTGTSSLPCPASRPLNPRFGSGPTTKRPNYDLQALPQRVLGRSHRSKIGKSVLQECVMLQRRLLGIPDNYHLGIVAGGDTGAFEMAMWSLLGDDRGVDIYAWESFGKGWVTDAVKQLRLADCHVHDYSTTYGTLPDFSEHYHPDRDSVFTWNGTTSGVRVPNGDWISSDRQGLTLCDATSAVFCQDLPWDKLDVVTYSWQKALGGEGGHGMLMLSPRAVERLEQRYVAQMGEGGVAGPWRPMPKLFRMVKPATGKFDKAIFTDASTINTPSMLAVEDCIDACRWVNDIGGRQAAIQRANDNLAAITAFVDKNSSWLEFLCSDPESRSNTSVCLQLTKCTPEQVKEITALLEEEGVAYDIGSYRDAPPGLRIWCGVTVATNDVKALCDWIAWAYSTVTSDHSAVA